MTACVSPTTVSIAAASGEILPSRTSGDDVDISPRPVMKEHHHFPFKLYDMLEHAADSEHSSVVSWVKEGGFAIHNKDDFLKHIVPHFFKQTKYRSFVSLFDGSRVVSSSAVLT